GAVHCMVGRDIETSTRFGKPEHVFVFSEEMRDSLQLSGGIFGILANWGWRQRSGMTFVSFPTSGFLWIWLALGWIAEFKLWRWSRSKVGGEFMDGSHSRRWLTFVSFLLFVVASTTTFLGIRAQAARDVGECRLQIRNIQIAVRSWSGVNSVNLGQPILWNKIVGTFIGPDTIHCPSGGDYLLSPLNPDVGQLAAKCPHPEHQDDTTKEAKKNEW
ncbi:MAG: hypothetical protein CFE26_11540, partial [Verrucomicrobiales bacterium VVV1]